MHLLLQVLAWEERRYTLSSNFNPQQIVSSCQSYMYLSSYNRHLLFFLITIWLERAKTAQNVKLETWSEWQHDYWTNLLTDYYFINSHLCVALISNWKYPKRVSVLEKTWKKWIEFYLWQHVTKSYCNPNKA